MARDDICDEGDMVTSCMSHKEENLIYLFTRVVLQTRISSLRLFKPSPISPP